MTGARYELGLHELADGVFAYLQPDGSWGYSNAGLVVGEGESLLVDTLFDLRLTSEMLEAMAPITRANPITTVVNTHSNGDHCHGNQLLPGARVIASAATAKEMADLPPSGLASLKELDLGEDANAFVAEAFGAFEFAGIDPPSPTETFSGRFEGDVGGRPFEAIELGPAHTAGDVIVHVPGPGVVFTGDLVFVGSTPIVWAGPFSNWLTAFTRIRELSPATVVPGHGPVVGLEALDAVEQYLCYVHEEAASRAAGGMGAEEAAFDIDLREYARWHDRERIVVNTDAVFAEVRPGHARYDPVSMLGAMGRYRRRAART